jgi:hypothetical protein
MVNGLCGGPGFLYAVFEYKGWPPMLSLALQSRSMPDVYVDEGLGRLGVTFTQHETTSRAAAQKTLDESLDRGKPALCVVDVASLPWYGLPKEFVGAGPHIVSIAGRDGSSYWIDDRAPHPVRVEGAVLAKARAAYRKAKHRLTTIDGPDARADARRLMADAIADTAKRYVEPAVPKSFWVNCGFAGLRKWKQMLTDPWDRKGWPTLFAEGPRAYAGLQRAYETIECHGTPGAGRAFYAEFLDEAASLLGRPPLAAAATAYRESARAWSRIASLIASSPDKAIRDACTISDRRLELGDASGAGLPNDSVELWSRRVKLGNECRLAKKDALAIYGEIADALGAIIASEEEAVTHL